MKVSGQLINDLLDAFVECDLDESQRLQLNELLRTDHRARRAYLEYFAIHAALSWEAVDRVQICVGSIGPPAESWQSWGPAATAAGDLPPGQTAAGAKSPLLSFLVTLPGSRPPGFHPQNPGGHDRRRVAHLFRRFDDFAGHQPCHVRGPHAQ